MAVDKPAAKPTTAIATKPAETRTKSSVAAPSTTSTADAKKFGTTVAKKPTTTSATPTAARDDAAEATAARLRRAREDVGSSLTATRPATTKPNTGKPAADKAAVTGGGPTASPDRLDPPNDGADGGGTAGTDTKTTKTKAGGTAGDTTTATTGTTGGAAAGAGAAEDGKQPGGTKPGPTQRGPAQPAGNPALDQQQDALGDSFKPGSTPQSREQARTYFETHDTYIDPTSGVEYQAKYDPATGELELRRDDVPVSPDVVPGGPKPQDGRAFDDPGEPLDDATPAATRPTQGHATSGSGGAKAGAGVGAALTDIVGKIAVAAVVDRSTGERMGADEALDSGVKKGVALLGEHAGDVGSLSFERHGPDASDRTRGHVAPDHHDGPTPLEPAPREPTPQPVQGSAQLDEVIVIATDGDRQTTRTFVVHHDAGGTVEVREQVASDHAGTVTGGTVDRTAKVEGDTGTEEFRTTDTYGAGGQLATRDRHDVTRTPDGATTTEDGDATFAAGKPTGTEQRLEYRFGPVTASEATTTTYTDGRKASAVIEQRAVDTSDSDFLSFGEQSEEATIRLTYGDEGQITAVDGPDATTDRSPLTDMIADHPTAAGDRFAFTQIRSEPGETNGTPTPALVSGPGIIAFHQGVEIFQEGGRVGQSGDNAGQIADIRSYIDAAPPGIREKLEHVDLLDGRNPADAYWEQEYDMPGFTSGAIGGGGRMTYFLNGAGEGTFYHELGHISGDGGGAPDEGAWDEAISSDDGIDDEFLAQGEVVDDGGIVHDGADGVTSYANTSYTNSGSESEDWAESVELWLSSRRNDGLVTVRRPDGTEVTATFEELYPGRAAILRKYYGE